MVIAWKYVFLCYEVFLFKSIQYIFFNRWSHTVFGQKKNQVKKQDKIGQVRRETARQAV